MTGTKTIGRPRTKPLPICTSCGKEFPWIEPDGGRNYKRDRCRACKPEGVRDLRRVSDLTGQKFGDWTAGKEGRRGSKATGIRARTYICQCKCGETKEFPVIYLVNGDSRCCEKCREKESIAREAEAVENCVGKTRGDFTVIGYDGKNEYGSRMWRCRCKCGKIRVLNTATLYNDGKQHQRCMACHREKDELTNRIFSVPHRFWKRFEANTERRGIARTVDIEYMEALFQKQQRKCAISGVDLYFTRLRTSYNRYTTASIDRIDSSKGYVAGNVQWVHKKVNMMKGSAEEADFLNLCRAIVENNKPKMPSDGQ